MSKITIDAREINTTTGVYIRNLLKELELLDKKNEYKVLVYPKDLDLWQPTNQKFELLPCPYKEYTFGEQIGLLQYVRSLKPDLVHFAMVQQPVLYKGKVVTTMHDLTTTRFKNPAKNFLVFTLKQIVYKWVNRVVARKSNAIIVPSEFVKDDVARFARINSRKITVTYEGADHVKASAEPLAELANSDFIFYVGRATPHKNLVRLVAAFSQLKKKHPKLKLVIAGKKSGNHKRLEGFVENSGVKDVIFSGFVSEGQLKWMYQNTKAYLFPSLSEGWGAPGLEAMAEGAPVVSSNATCLPEVLGDAAHYFDPLSVEDMAQKIEEVISSKKLTESLIKKGHEQVKKYSWKTMAEQTLEIYKTVLEN